MKKLILSFIVCFLMVLHIAELRGQTKYDSPRNAVMDTLSYIGQTRSTRDFFFNPACDSAGVVLNYGIFDYIVEADMWSSVEDADTLTLEVYGLVRVRNTLPNGHAVEGYKTWAIDSTRLGTLPVGTTESCDVFPIDIQFTTMLQYDGVRIVQKLGSTSEADSVKTWSVVRGYIPSVVK